MKQYTSAEVTTAFTDQQWEIYWNLVREIQQAKNEPSVIASWQELKRDRLEADSTKLKEVMLYEENEPAGKVRLRKRNEDFIEAEIETKYPEPPLTLLQYAARILLQQMETLEIEQVNYKTGNKVLRDFSESIGAKVVNHYFYYRLECEKADKEKISEWLALIPRKNPSVTLEIYKGVPTEHIDEYAELFISLLKDMPRDASLPPQPPYSEEDIKRDLRIFRGRQQMWSGLLFEENKMIGLTNLTTYHNNPYHAFQHMTGTRKEHRGRGLAQWMKAAMFKHLLSLSPQPEMLYTSTFSLNKPMQSINFAMGYELQREGYEYTLLRKELKKAML